jgi:hypothetical protein
LNEAVVRLAVAHPTRRVYPILAIDLEWMPFLRDPVAPTLNPQGSPLNIMKDNRRDTWQADPRIHMISLENLMGQRHVISTNNVDTRLAYSLDFWTLDQNGTAPQNIADLNLLGSLFTPIQNTTYQGQNPDA